MRIEGVVLSTATYALPGDAYYFSLENDVTP
jgi:hypothetical protein